MTHDNPLSPQQQAILARLLRNESDVAYRRRVWTMLRYLNLRPGQIVLDCGTGMGFYAAAINRLYPDVQVYGIDAEEKVLRFAQAQVGPQTTLVRGDIHRLPFADERFDAVVMSEVLEHLPDDLGGLRQVHRVLKPGGTLALTVPYRHYSWWYDPINRMSEVLLKRPIRQGAFAGIWANHERLYDADQLVHVLTESGFLPGPVAYLTHYCFPGTQTIVYTVGKGLIERNLLPGFIKRSTHRFEGEANRGSWLNPLNWAVGLFHRIDRLNEDPRRIKGKETFANLAVRAIKP